MPLRNLVVFPFNVVPLAVGIPRSKKLIEDAAEGNRLIGLASMKNREIEEPLPGQTHEIGTIAKGERVLQTKDDNIQVIVQGLERFRIEYWLADRPYLRAHIQPAPDTIDQALEMDALQRSLQELAQAVVGLSPNMPKEAGDLLAQVKDPRYLTYLDWILELPWKTLSEDQTDIRHARAILDEDHYDLAEVKDRIIEHLAVRKLVMERRLMKKSADEETDIDAMGVILCFSGPPGVGKTSLGKGIARALGRKFTRMSLGGMRDEAEIRGHRRTYIGAMPGRIIQGIKRTGTRMQGRGKLSLTGQLGDVMRESAQIAHSYVRSKADQLGIDPDQFEKTDVHLHVPAGAVPKDGPSAGIAMVMAIAGLFTGRPVRGDVGMTGEVTLRGRLLPVGGIKMKMLAAHRAGLNTVILSKRNEKDLEDLPDEVRNTMLFVTAERIDEALNVAFCPPAPLNSEAVDSAQPGLS